MRVGVATIKSKLRVKREERLARSREGEGRGQTEGRAKRAFHSLAKVYNCLSLIHPNREAGRQEQGS